MNSERLKDFRQTAYELSMRALLCHFRANGCSDDHARMRLVWQNFHSVRYSIDGQVSMKPYKTVDQTEKN